MRSASTPTFLEVARTLAVRAAERVNVLSQSPLVRERKADHSIVTNADREADQIIRDGLRQAFPDHAILTEESGLDGSTDAEYIWLIDPIDGTSAFAKGKPGYSVMIGLLKNRKPFLGVVVDPFEGHVFEAVHGEGAFHTLNKKRQRIHVSKRQTISEMPVIVSNDFPKKLEDRLRPDLNGPWLPPINSVGIKVGIIVRQLADLYINHRTVHFWDTCGPQIILEEAGGKFTLWNGKELVYSIEDGVYEHAGSTLASNGTQHKEILQILREAKPLS